MAIPNLFAAPFTRVHLTRISHTIEYALLAGVAFLFRWLPMPVSRALGRSVGRLAVVLGIRHRVAVSNIRRAFPHYNPRETEQCYLRTWLHFGMVAAELSRLPRMNLSDLEHYVNHENLEIVEKIFARGKGAIFVSGHIGNWEWLGALMAAKGIPFTFVVEKQANRLVEEWMDRMRMRPGVDIVSRSNAPRGTLKALKCNRMVAILCDQDAGSSGVFVPFFGTPASTPRGPALFHLKTGAALVYGSCCRDGDSFRLRLEEIPIDDVSGELTENEQSIMAKITSHLEADVRRYPDQYMWLHRRWKTVPAE